MNTYEQNVADFLLSGRDPVRTALWTLDRAYSYADLDSASYRVVRYLASLQLDKGDRVLLAAENSLFWVAAYLGTLRAGLVSVPVPVGTLAQDLDYILLNTEAKAAFAGERFVLRNQQRFRGCHVVSSLESIPQGGEAVAAPEPARGDDLAALMFTSGSTGRPRGVMISHRNIIANTESIVEYLHLNEDDCIMAVLPFHYCFGTSLLHTHLRVGARLVLDHRFMYPELILHRMIETRCTGFAGVPTHFQILLRRSGIKTRQFPHLRYVQQAGGHLAPALIAELQAALPDTEIFTMYGQTEATARLSYLPPEMLDRKRGSIGRAIPGVTLSVLDESGHAVRPGEVGEIVAEGDNIASGYWRAPADSAACFRDGRLYTGDRAKLDEDGYIYVVGRAKDFLKCGGKRVSCRSIEDIVLGFDDVVEAAVIGVFDEILGEAAKLFVVPRESNSDHFEERLRVRCKASMPPWCIPREIVVLSSLPKNSSGKVLKEQLKQEEQCLSSSL